MKKHFHRIVILVMSVVMTVTAVPPVYANEAMYRLNNDVVWTNPDAACAADSGSSTTLSGDDNMTMIWNFLIEKGLNDNQAAGVMGNVGIESGHTWSPFVAEFAYPLGTGRGYGIVQWTGSRHVAIKNELKKKLPDVFDTYYKKYGSNAAEVLKNTEAIPKEVNENFLAVELDFLYAESTSRQVHKHFGSGSEWDALKRANSIKEASDVWLYSFEKPGSVLSGGRVVFDTPSSINASKERAKGGQDIYDKLKGQSGSNVSPASFSGGSGECSSLNQNPGSVKALQELTLKYAHHRKIVNHSSGATTPTEEYKAAVNKAKSSGIYTGDGCYGGGIDCGAFVTLLLINSGWEPNYNYGGKFSNGAGNTIQQEAWMKKNWERLGTGGEIDVANLQPGDVAINADHTFVYVGDIEGFPSKIASASQCGRAPSAGSERIDDPGMTWYRKKAGSGEITGV